MPFNPEMMILARESRGYTQTDLSTLLPFKQGTISKIEGGLLEPPPSLVPMLADTLHYTEEFFEQSDAVWGFNASVFFHRKRQSLPDKILRKLHAQMNLTRMRANRLFRSVALSPKFRFHPIEPGEYEGGVVGAARIVRSLWTLPSGPVRNVTEVIERANGVVFKFDFGTRKADAISEWSPDGVPIFMVNSHPEISGARLRLTLAHELAHVILHTQRGEVASAEKEANEFAAEFMMPRREIKSSLYGLTMAKLGELKKIWRVSMQALIQRAYELKTITDSQRKYLFINVGRRGGRIHEPFDSEIPLEEPTLINDLIQKHVSLGYSAHDLARLLFFRDVSEFEQQILGVKRLRLV